MAAAAQRAPPQFVVSVGDNFYPSGLTSVDDPNFADSFQNVYHHAELQVIRCETQPRYMSATACLLFAFVTGRMEGGMVCHCASALTVPALADLLQTGCLKRNTHRENYTGNFS